MNQLANYGIAITSYELNGMEEKPILTHIFWGKDIIETLNYTKSHLISDYFFMATFKGDMTWRDGKLHLSHSNKILSIHPIYDEPRVNTMILNEIEREVKKIFNIQIEYKIPEIVNEMSKYK